MPMPPSGESARPEREGQGFLMLRGLVIPLPRDRDVVLGRDKALSDVVLAHEHVSKRHSMVFYRSGRYFITDLESLNGTFVNQKRIDGPVALVAGDEITLPPYMMLFFGPEHPASPSAEVGPSPREAARQKGHFSGLLSILRITDLIQMLNSTTQSGTLWIRDPDGTNGEISFSHGEILQARYGTHTAETAIYEVLKDHAGEFEFVQGHPPAPPHPIAMSTMSMLLEGVRLLDEQASPPPPKTLPPDRHSTTHIPLSLN